MPRARNIAKQRETEMAVISNQAAIATVMLIENSYGPFQIIFKDEPSRKWLVRHAGMAVPILAINCDTLESTKQQCELLASKYDWNANSLIQFAEKNGKTLTAIYREMNALLIGQPTQ